MKVRKDKQILARGSTYMETVAALLIVGFAIVGTLQTRYYSTKDVLEANIRQTGIHLATRIIESWRYSEDTNFDLITAFASDYSISAAEGSAVPNGFTWLGSYQITINQVDYSANLSYKTQTQNTPATLNVQVFWYRAGDSNQDCICSLTSYMNL